MVTVLEAIKNRRSIRKYKLAPVPDEVILELLECARLAPSAHNWQPRRFMVIKDEGIKKKLKDCAYGLQFLESAPCVIVCCADLMAFGARASRRRMKELLVSGALDDVGSVDSVPDYLQGTDDYAELRRYRGQAAFDSAIATEHIVLAALAFGLGTCWIHMFQPEKVHKLLKLPDNITVVSLLALGYPDQDPQPRPRLPLADIVLTPNPTKGEG
jgi:nitroreductase